MRKLIWTLSVTWLALAGACVATLEEGDPAAEEVLESSTEQADWVPFCADLPHQTIVTPESCSTSSGQLGVKQCSQTCTIHRAARPQPQGGFACVITGQTCGPKSCGPCSIAL
jgi:hypothetical protein